MAVNTDGVVSIADAGRDELASLFRMETGSDTSRYIISHSLETHQAQFDQPEIRYKSIYADAHRLVGFMILVLEPDGRSIEFRRIVISEKGCGYGRRAVELLNDICRDELGRERIWLDVFEFNDRARNLYESCGYRSFAESQWQGMPLRLYEKLLPMDS